ncbi:3-oxoacyl-[acyl-carrier-protein] synthase III, chloroplastic [Capsicum annuum]|nr:3-oxoacyl-[acyl-carrier-protein] synthase III, chloroplastic [Capsicum annuum]
MASATIAAGPTFSLQLRHQVFGSVGISNLRQHQGHSLLFTPAASTIRKRFCPSISMYQVGKSLSDGTFNSVVCSSTVEGADKLSTDQSRVSRLVSRGCKLIGCGSAVPALKISNDDLAKIVDTNDEWISVRTGIPGKGRVILKHPRLWFSYKCCVMCGLGTPHEFEPLHSQKACPNLIPAFTGKDNLTDLAAEAARKALEMAEVDPNDIDLILLCSSTPEDLFGSAPQIQKALGCKSNPLAFDITAACSGFMLGLVSAACYIRGGGFKNVLVVGADALSRYVDWTDRGTCILFGDAAGAVVMQACDIGEDGLFGFDLHSDGEGQRHLNASFKENESDRACGTNGSVIGFPPKTSSYSCIQMNGKEVFRFAVRVVPQSIEAALENAGLPQSKIDWLLLHQRQNLEIISNGLELKFLVMLEIYQMRFLSSKRGILSKSQYGSKDKQPLRRNRHVCRQEPRQTEVALMAESRKSLRQAIAQREKRLWRWLITRGSINTCEGHVTSEKPESSLLKEMGRPNLESSQNQSQLNEITAQPITDLPLKEMWKQIDILRTSEDLSPRKKRDVLPHATKSTMENFTEREEKDANSPEKSVGIYMGEKKRGMNIQVDQQVMIENSFTGGEIWDVEEAIPIAIELENEIVVKERVTSAWVHQNIIKLGKMFGVDFKGHEEEATKLLMQIDACRQARRM